MHTTKICSFGICLLASMLVTSVTNADIVWNESVSGDLSNFDTSPTSLSFSVGVNDVIGTIGGRRNRNNGDGYDVFSFTIGANDTLTSINVNDYQVSGGNTSTGFNLYRSDGTFLGGEAIDVGDINGDVLDLTGAGDLGAGDYYVEMREFSAPNQSYSFGFNVVTAVPEPTSLVVVFGVVTLMASRRRNRKC